MMLFLARCEGGANKGGPPRLRQPAKFAKRAARTFRKVAPALFPERSAPPAARAAAAAGGRGSAECPPPAQRCNRPRRSRRNAPKTLQTQNVVEVALTPTCHMVYTNGHFEGESHPAYRKPSNRRSGTSQRRHDRLKLFRRRRAAGRGQGQLFHCDA